MNIYETTTMLAAVKTIPAVNTFFRDTFFPKSADKTLLTENVILDTFKGKRKVAPFVAPRVGGVTINREAYESHSIKAPKIAPQRVLTVDDLNTRLIGESIVSTKTPAQREAEILANDLSEMTEMIDRREELMVRDLLLTGKVIVKGYVDYADKNFVEQEINYGEGIKYNITKKWNTPDSDIYEDLRLMRLEIIQKSGKAPTTLVLSSDLVTVLLGDEKLSEVLDKRNIYLGEINPVIKNETTTFIGRISALGLDIYSYDEVFYNEETGKDEPMMPEKTVIMCSSNMGSMYYGLVTQMEQDGKFMSYEGDRVPKIWNDFANDQKMARITSRPVPVPTSIDAWRVAKVI